MGCFDIRASDLRAKLLCADTPLTVRRRRTAWHVQEEDVGELLSPYRDWTALTVAESCKKYACVDSADSTAEHCAADV